MQVSNCLLMNEIGKIVCNSKNEMVGRIADIANDNKHKPNYIILSCDKLKGFGSKYFAIPLIGRLVKINKGHKMVLNIELTDLKQAHEINFDENFAVDRKILLKKVLQLVNYHATKKVFVP